MWQPLRHEDGWSPWTEFGPVVAGAPSVFADARGRLHILAAGAGERLGHMAQRSPNGVDGWTAWTELGPEVSGRTRSASAVPAGWSTGN